MTTENTAIKISKNHGGKEFSNSFRLIGQVKASRKKEKDSDNWVDVPLYQETTTKTGKQRRVLQFVIETASRNELKVEQAGMEKDFAFAWSRKHNKTQKLKWNDRKDKSKLEDETYYIMTQEWDLTEDIAEWLEVGQWVDVRGKYEFSSFTNDEGKEINTVKRMIQNVYPLKDAEVEIKGLNENDEFKVFLTEKSTQEIGYGKADNTGIAKIKVGLLNPEGGTLYVCKLEGDKEGKRTPIQYNDGVSGNERITVRNNLTPEIKVDKKDGTKETVTYVRDFKSPDFVEVNTFNMQVGIRSTYQDEQTKDTNVNGVFLSYGKEKSVPNDVELIVYHKEGAKPLSDAFARLNQYDFMEVVGIDNNRTLYAWVDVEENEDDNPFADVDDKVTKQEKVANGTKKGLEVLNYVTGSYMKELLTEEEFIKPEPVIKNEQPQGKKEEKKEEPNPFETIDESDLPF